MVADPEWEYHYRWVSILERGIANSVAELEARDVSLEEHLRLFGTASCSIVFDYPFRWNAIIESPYSTQVAMLQARDDALMDAINYSGSCPIEIPFKWAQIWEGLVKGEDWALACAEENDRAIEDRFRTCNCGGG